MGEFAPIAGGLVAGFVIGRYARIGPGRSALVVLASVTIGILACALSGELARSWAFLAIDIPEALVPQVFVILALDRLGSVTAGERPAS